MEYPTTPPCSSPTVPAPRWPADALRELLLAGATPRALRALLTSNISLEDYLGDPATIAHLHDVPRVDLAEPPEAPDGITELSLLDERYPARLRELSAPPPVLFVRGALDALAPSIAIIGTRRLSDLGRATIPPVIAAARELGTPVVSGLALGADAHAHALALRAELPTVGVLASSVTDLTPLANAPLAAQILEQGGALVAEIPCSDATTANAPRLMARNRLIVALATTVVPAECDLTSGTMAAVGQALLLGRFVVVPRPRPVARHLPGAQGLLALCGDLPLHAEHLRIPAALLTELTGTTRPVANAACDTPADLREMVKLAHWFATS
jgi:DNA processing protein